MKRIEITSAGCGKTYHRSDGAVVPCEYGTMSIIQIPTQEDIDAEVARAVTVYEQALGQPAADADRARLRVDVLARLGYPAIWTQEIENEVVSDMQESQAKLMDKHNKVGFKIHPHADASSDEHRRAVKPPRKASVTVVDVPLGTDVRPKVKARGRRSN